MKNKTKEELVLQLIALRLEIKFQMQQTEGFSTNTIKILLDLDKEISNEIKRREDFEIKFSLFSFFAFFIAVVFLFLKNF